MVQLQMLDLDIVERAAGILKSRVGHRKRLTPNGHTVWFTQLSGRHAASWMMTLFGLLGERRRATIQTRLARWKAAPFAPQDRKVCPRGHVFDVLLPKRRCRQCARDRYHARKVV